MKRAVVIEDEVHSRELMCLLLTEYCAGIELVGAVGNAWEGQALIEKERPELVFLDVEMPGGDGLDLGEEFWEAAQDIVFVTGYREGRNLEMEKKGLAWLRKPVDLLELRELLEELGEDQSEAGMREEEGSAELEVLGEEGIALADVLYIEGSRRYALLALVNGQSKLGRLRIEGYEELLKGSGFFRIHRNFLVRLEAVAAYEGGRAGKLTLRNGKSLPVAARRKKAFVQALKNNS